MDKRISPYKISSSFDGDLNFSVSRDIGSANSYGFQVDVNLGEDKMTISPTLFFQASDKVRVFSSVALDSDMGSKIVLGAEYEFSEETKVLVSYSSTFEEVNQLKETIILTQLQHQGYVFKMPIYGCSNKNLGGHALTFSLFAIYNFAAYKLL